MLNFILGAIGTGKTSTIAEKISRQIAGGQNVLVIVPEQFTFEYEHMLYSKLGAFDYNRISVRSFKRLAAEIIRESGGKHRMYADGVTKSLLMSLAVKKTAQNDGLVFYNKLAKSPMFSAMMLDCISDLSQSGLDDDKLIAGADSLSGALKEKFTDILNIYFTYCSLLNKHNLSDEKSAITYAATLAAKYGFFENKCVFIDEFKSFTADEKLLIEAMLAQSDVCCALDTDDENSKLLHLYSVNRTFSALKRLAQKISAKITITRTSPDSSAAKYDIIHISQSIFKNTECEKIESENIRIVDALNIYDECEYVFAEIRRLCREEGLRFDEIALVARDAQMYRAIIDEYSKIYEIPVFESVEKTPYNTALSVFITTALEMTFSTFSTEKLLMYAKTMLIGIDITEISQLENFCYIWDIDGKLWEKEFSQDDSAAIEAENTRRKIINPLLKLREKCKSTTGDAITRAIFEHFETVGLMNNLNELTKGSGENDEQDTIEQARELRLMWNVLADTLDIFHTYLENIEISPAEYRDMLSCALSAAHYSNAPQRSNSVSFTQLQLTRYNSPKVVFILGANEGYFPRNSVTVGMFTSTESQKLSANGIELAKTDEQIYSEESFAVYAAVSAPTKKLYITYPLLDKSNGSKTGAHTLKLIENMFSNKITLCANSLDDEFYSTTKEAAYRRYVRSFGKDTVFEKSCEAVLCNDIIYGEKIKALKSGTLSKKQHSLDERDVVRLLYSENLKMSASKLETFCLCPFRYYMSYGLKIRPLQKKAITVNEKGSIVHFCLERIFKDYEKDEFLKLTKQQIDSIVAEYIRTYRDEKLGGDYRESEKFEYNLKIIAENTSEIIENLQREFSQSDFYPCESEYWLKREFALSVPDIPKAAVTLSGITDRIDLYVSSKGKFIRVVDYKTGKKTFSLSDLVSGKNMQMFLYLFALTSSDERFSECTPAGVLYYHANETVPSLPRTSDEKKLDELKAKSRRMIGVILDDDEIISSMDKGAGVIPITRNKDGSISKNSLKNLLSTENFNSLDRYCTETVKRCAERILSGNIAALPYKDACTFCDYKNVCGNYPNETIMGIEESTDTLVKGMLSGEYSYGDSMKAVAVNPKEDDEDVDE